MENNGLLDSHIGCKFDEATEREDRLNFCKKVYSILGVQLLITAFMCIIPMTNEKSVQWMRANYGLMIGACIVALVVSCALICIRSLSRTVPVNYIALFIFTVAEAYMMAFICAST
jgi:FtsH-binding integral membrane protein